MSRAGADDEYSKSSNQSDSFGGKKDKSKTRKKWSKKKKILIGILIVLIILISIPTYIVWSKLNNIKYEAIDKNDLDVNSDLYNEVSDKVSESEFKDIKTVAFFGSDSRNTEDIESGRADSIIIASINPVKKTIKLISIPRDTYVTVPGYGKTKINHAYAYGGEQLLIKTINNNFGLNITEYATIDFSGLINVINAVGGIEMNISKDEMGMINQYLIDSYKLTGKTYVAMTKYGNVTLNGEQALAHSRDRYVGNDFDRANRQRTVLMSLFSKMSTMNKTKALSVITDVFFKQVKTNINVTDYVGLLTSVLSSKDEYTKNIISTQVPSTDYASGQTIDGVYYFVADLNKAKADFKTYLYEK